MPDPIYRITAWSDRHKSMIVAETDNEAEARKVASFARLLCPDIPVGISTYGDGGCVTIIEDGK